MVATARFLPVKIITDRAKIRSFAKATSPVIKLIDPIIGEKVTTPLCCVCIVHAGPTLTADAGRHVWCYRQAVDASIVLA